MPATESAQNRNWKRKFELRRETEDKKSPPRFFEWVKEPPEPLPKGCLGVRDITSAAGKRNFYLMWSGWSGSLIDLRVEDITIGTGKPEKHLIASLDDDHDVVEVRLPFFKTYSRDLMKRVLGPNFNPKSSLSMSPYAMDNKDGGAQNVGISCLSGANKLTAKASDFGGTQPDPHLAQMPRPSNVVVGGEQITDYTEQSLWLWAQIEKSVLPNLPRFGETVPRTALPAPSPAPSNPTAASPYPSFPSASDIPFREDARQGASALTPEFSDLPF